MLKLWSRMSSVFLGKRNATTIFQPHIKPIFRTSSHISDSFRYLTTNPPILQGKKEVKEDEGDNNQLEELFEEEKQDNNDYQELIHRLQLLPGEGHQVFIIQPYVKWGPKKNVITTPELMLEEAEALIDSLPNWKCVDSIKIPTETLGKKQVFGSGQFENLQQQIVRNPNISAVFVSLNILRGVQRKYYSTFFFTYRLCC